MIIFNTDYLRNNPTGVIRGTESDKKKSCLSQDLITDFIDDYFNGMLEIKLKNDSVVKISAKLSKMLIDDIFIEKYFSKIGGEIVTENIYISNEFKSTDDDNDDDNDDDIMEFEFDAMAELTDKERMMIIGDTFCALIGLFDGYLTCKVFSNHIEFRSK
jgi:hypothetical protein